MKPHSWSQGVIFPVCGWKDEFPLEHEMAPLESEGIRASDEEDGYPSNDQVKVLKRN